MLKSPEEYLAGLSFDLPESSGGEPDLDAGERTFVEKYLGADALGSIPHADPEPVPLPQLQPLPETRRQPSFTPAIIVAPPAAQIAVQSSAPEIIVSCAEEKAAESAPVIAIAPEKPATDLKIAEKSETMAKTVSPARVTVRTEAAVEADLKISGIDSHAKIETLEKEAVATVAPAVKVASAQATQTVQKVAATEQVTAEAQAAAESEAVTAPVPPELALREKMRQAAQIQVVSFFVAEQLFLLPVEGIQEVLRHMELVRVPQAPEFVAGAINLRGTVMPLVHLSALLTNSRQLRYDERSFIIVTGSSSLQMGLIIDRVNSMHMIPQKKIIWNAESKLGEAAEFLSAIVDLDDRVCGMISPDIITQKLFSEF